MTCSPADDAPQHIAPSLIGWQYPVAHQESACPGMVCNDPDGHVKVFVPAVFLPGKITDKADERGEQVGVIVALDALEDRGDALKPHARIDVGCGQGAQVFRSRRG